MYNFLAFRLSFITAYSNSGTYRGHSCNRLLASQHNSIYNIHTLHFQQYTASPIFQPLMTIAYMIIKYIRICKQWWWWSQWTHLDHCLHCSVVHEWHYQLPEQPVLGPEVEEFQWQTVELLLMGMMLHGDVHRLWDGEECQVRHLRHLVLQLLPVQIQEDWKRLRPAISASRPVCVPARQKHKVVASEKICQKMMQIRCRENMISIYSR